MAEVTLEFIAERLERIQTELAAIRDDLYAIRTDMAHRQIMTGMNTEFSREELDRIRRFFFTK